MRKNACICQLDNFPFRICKLYELQFMQDIQVDQNYISLTIEVLYDHLNAHWRLVHTQFLQCGM